MRLIGMETQYLTCLHLVRFAANSQGLTACHNRADHPFRMAVFGRGSLAILDGYEFNAGEVGWAGEAGIIPRWLTHVDAQLVQRS